MHACAIRIYPGRLSVDISSKCPCIGLQVRFAVRVDCSS